MLSTHTHSISTEQPMQYWGNQHTCKDITKLAFQDAVAADTAAAPGGAGQTAAVAALWLCLVQLRRGQFLLRCRVRILVKRLRWALQQGVVSRTALQMIVAKKSTK